MANAGARGNLGREVHGDARRVQASVGSYLR